MKCGREIKKWHSAMRKHYAKRNGVIPRWAFDCPEYERKVAKAKAAQRPCRAKVQA